MPLRDRNERIRDHILSVTRRKDDDYDVLADALHSVAWPDGGVDRRDAGAETWFKRFTSGRGSGPAPIPPACGCRIGRCLVCN